MKKSIFGFLFIGCAALVFNSCGRNNSNDQIRSDTASIQKGAVIFQQNCSSCHNFNRDGIGPDLSGITLTDSVSWLKNFIADPKQMIDSGDAHAKKLLENYHVLMPSFAMNDENLDLLIAFLHTHKVKMKDRDDPSAIHNPVPEKIASSGIRIDMQYITQIPPSSDKEPLTRISKMEWLPSGQSWFILDQRGILYKTTGPKPTAWLDIRKWKSHFINQPGLATGFGSFALHPDFSHNGIFYTSHCEEPNTAKADFSLPDSIKKTLQWVLTEWQMKNANDTVFKGTNRELLRIDMVTGLHGLQEISFKPGSDPKDPDYGKLFIGVGDGGSVENGYSWLTNHPDHIWGTILRIDPGGHNSKNKQYGIPEGNPYFKNPDTNTIREIYADGFRNPNRITWTPDHMMLATNIGQANIESINIIRKGGHYGWPIREGTFSLHADGSLRNIYPLPKNDSIYHISYPVAIFDHDEGNAIEGGFVYEGKTVPALNGKYVFGDITSGRLFFIETADLHAKKTAVIKEWFVSFKGKPVSLRDLCGQNRVDLRFGKDNDGEIYVFTKPDGKIYRLVNE